MRVRMVWRLTWEGVQAQCSRAMLIGLGVLAVLIVVGGVATVVVLAQKQSAEDENTAPPSRPADFIAPVSSGGFRFRHADESTEEFKEHIKAANEEFESRSRRSPPTSG